jgi:hypothetical protein
MHLDWIDQNCLGTNVVIRGEIAWMEWNEHKGKVRDDGLAMLTAKNSSHTDHYIQK